MNQVVLANKNKPEKISSIYKPRYYTWGITIIGISVYVLSAIFFLFSLLILLNTRFRDLYLNWSLASIVSALLMIFMAKQLIKKFGASYFVDDHIGFTIKTIFSRTYTIYKQDIVHIAVKRSNAIIEKLPLSQPKLVIYTTDKVYRISTLQYQYSEKLISHFDDLSEHVTDEFAEYYHKSTFNLGLFILRFSQDTPGIIGLTIIIIYTFLALWGGFAMLIGSTSPIYSHTLFLRNPEFLNHDLPNYTFEETIYHPPNADFWFGTDFVGRDVFSRLVYGTTFTFMIAVTGSFLSMFFILFFGLSSAFYQGWWDNLVTRVSDTLLSFPPFIFLILISTLSVPLRVAIPGGFFLAVYAGMSIVTWPVGARMIRSEVIELLNQEYIVSVFHLGATKRYVFRKHVLMKILPTILILFAFVFGDIILGTTLLGFIGFGAESTLTWGSDISHAIHGLDIMGHWWAIIFPTVWLFLLIFGLTLFADSVRDNLDPKLRGGVEAVPYAERIEHGI